MATRKTTTAKPVTKAATATAAPKKTVKKFADDELMTCVSITAGELICEGKKTRNVYDFVEIGDVVEMEYADLINFVRTKSPYVYKPRFIVQNDEFLEQHNDIKELYNGLYTIGDLKEVLRSSASDMERILPQLPLGAQDSLKTLAMNAIKDGELDSIQKIKVVDKFFGTDMLMQLTR